MRLKDLSSQLMGLEPASECVGIQFRYKRTHYIGSRGDVNFKDTFSPLKKMSCGGCNECGWVPEYIEEEMNSGEPLVTWSDTLQDGDIVRIKMTNMTTDWETGYVDGWELEFVKVEK